MRNLTRLLSILFIIVFISNTKASDTIVNKLLSNYQYSKAIKIIEQKENKNLNDFKNLGFCYNKMGNYKLSINNYKRALLKDSTNISVLFQLGILNKRTFNYEKSKYFFNKLYQIDSNNNYYLKQLAIVNIKLKDYETSINQFKNILISDSNDLESVIEISKLYLLVEKPLLADSILEKAIKYNENNIRLLTLGLKASFLSEKFNSTVKIGNNLVRQKEPSFNTKKLLAFAHYNTSSFDSAITWFTKINDEEQSEQTLYYTGMSYYKIKLYDNSAIYFEKAIDKGISENLSNYYFYLGISLEKTRNYTKAISVYKKSYKLSKNNIVMYHIARSYDINFNNKQTAKMYYKKYLALNDTLHKDVMEYSKIRLTKINEELHFEVE